MKNWVEVWAERAESQGVKALLHCVGAALGRGGEEAAFGAEEVHVEVGEGGLGQILEGDVELAGRGIGGDGAGKLDVGGEAVGDEEDAVAVAGLGFAEVDGAGEGAGEAGVSTESVPILESSGHWASSVVPKRASASEQVVLPSVALGLREKPSGRVTVAARARRARGRWGSRTGGR